MSSSVQAGRLAVRMIVHESTRKGHVQACTEHALTEPEGGT